MASDTRAARLGVLAAVAVILFGALGVRLWFLQTVEATKLQNSVQVERTKTVRLIPERGRIFDADGRILADNERILTIGIDWDAMVDESDRRALFERLSGWIDVPVREMQRRYGANVYSPYVPMPVKEDVDERVANALMERSEDFPGVAVMDDERRRYPYAPLAAPVLGYLGSIPEEGAEAYVARGYELNERVGKDGIELSLEDTLHGKWGEVTFRVNAAGQVLEEISRRPPVNGRDIQLALDLDVQQYAESILQTQLQLRRTFSAKNPIVEKPLGNGTSVRERIDPDAGPRVPYKAPAGSVVVLDQENGQIAAMATYPNFDNRWFNAGVSSEKFAELFPPDGPDFDPDTATLVNRAVQGQYNLGSTFKPFTAYAALDSGLFTPETIHIDEGTYKLTSIEDDVCATGNVRCEFRNSTCGGTVLPCEYGPVNMQTAIAVSSDTFFYRIGEELFDRGENILRDEVERWGFGRDTGVDLPYEFDGRVPDSELKQELLESGALNPDLDIPRLIPADNLQTAIGQGLMAASPLQLAQGYAAIGNGGEINQPHVVRAIYEPGVPDGTPGYADLRQGQLVKSFLEGEVTGTVPVQPDHLETIVSGLRRNITGPGVVHNGNQLTTTAQELFAIGYPKRAIQVAGKTGTAQAAGSKPWEDSSAFAAFSLDGERPYTVAAYLEKSGFGSQGAGPVVKCMYLALSGISPTRPVTISDPLDITSSAPAAAAPVADTKCLKSTIFDPNPVD